MSEREIVRLHHHIAAVVFVTCWTLVGDAAPQPDAVCAPCHKVQFEAQAKTSMALALESVAGCEILQRHPDLSFSDGVYSYRIIRQGAASIYSVTDGKETISVPISWAFGLGTAGQTYLFERSGRWFESRVSYFQSINALDFTLGAASVRPANLEAAAGRAMNLQQSGECFHCHATSAISGGKLDASHLVAGIHCERCHANSGTHVASFQTARSSSPEMPATEMPKLSKSSAEEMSVFCGQCHRTWAQIASNGPFGIGNIRFQPYRLTNSKCYDASDPRISCTACHDPHKETVGGSASFDSKCQACHSSGRHASARNCRVAKADCSNCHMPRLELPGSHHKFTDHEIRIVRANEKYPD